MAVVIRMQGATILANHRGQFGEIFAQMKDLFALNKDVGQEPIRTSCGDGFANLTVIDWGFDRFCEEQDFLIRWLRANREILNDFFRSASLSCWGIDFGVRCRKEYASQSYRFRLELIKLASELSLDLELSLYEISE